MNTRPVFELQRRIEDLERRVAALEDDGEEDTYTITPKGKFALDLRAAGVDYEKVDELWEKWVVSKGAAGG